MPDGFSPDYTPRERFLTVAEAKALLAQLTPDRAARVAFILATGARWGESESARREDVDGELVYLRGTKTSGSRRVVPLVGPGINLVEHSVHSVRYAEGSEGRLFRPWPNARRDIAEACARAEIDRASPNDLRRTYATWLRQAEVEPHLIGAALGHTDSRMVERVYGRIPTEALAMALRWRVEGRGVPPTEPQKTSAASSSSARNSCSAFVAATCVSEAPKAPETRSQTAISPEFLVSRARIELATRGFSVRCSTD
jgi:integrase